MVKKEKVTIKMVADEAGVSKSTVSRVISDYQDISDDTKKKVREVMKKLNYHPSAIARSLANRISKNVGLVLPSDEDFFLNPFFQESLRAIAITASSRGYDTMLVYNDKDETTAINRLVSANKVDGMILMRAIVNDKSIQYLKDNKVPFVLIGNSLENKDIYSVDTDNFKACQELTRILVENGCKKIGFIGGDKNSVVTLDRLKGYMSVVKEKNLYKDKTMIQENEFTKLNGYRSIEKILSDNEDIDGMIVTDALIFRGVVDYLTEVNYGKDIILGTFGAEHQLGYDDRFKVFNVDVQCMKMGQASCNKLIDILDGQKVNKMDIIDYKIM